MDIGELLVISIWNGKDNTNSEKSLEFDKRLAIYKSYLTFLAASSLAVFQTIEHAAIKISFPKCLTPLLKHRIDSSALLG